VVKRVGQGGTSGNGLQNTKANRVVIKLIVTKRTQQKSGPGTAETGVKKGRGERVEKQTRKSGGERVGLDTRKLATEP